MTRHGMTHYPARSLPRVPNRDGRFDLQHLVQDILDMVAVSLLVLVVLLVMEAYSFVQKHYTK